MSESEQTLPACYGCEKCGYRTARYKPLCRRCGHSRIIGITPSSAGSILDFIPTYYPPENLKNLGPYISVLVKLDNDCNMFGIMLEDAKMVEAGQNVVVDKFDRKNGLLVFKRT